MGCGVSGWENGLEMTGELLIHLVLTRICSSSHPSDVLNPHIVLERTLYFFSEEDSA